MFPTLFVGFSRVSRRCVGRVPRDIFSAIIASILCFGCAGKPARFATPDAAVLALVEAVRANDEPRLREIMGGGAEEVLSSGDEVADQNARERFLESYDEKNSLEEAEDGVVTLVVGSNDWPMPVPIVNRRGQWQFDPQRGREEILNRRIGANELYTIEVCRAIVDAQKEYFAADPDGDGTNEYAMRFLSESGTRNGLYWETTESETPSPLGPLMASASAEGYALDDNDSSQPNAYHGYYYRMLTRQGDNAIGGAEDYLENDQLTKGFAVVAWPAEYGNSGVMTFLVNHRGLVYQRDLGRSTDRQARNMRSFDPDARWMLSE